MVFLISSEGKKWSLHYHYTGNGGKKWGNDYLCSMGNYDEIVFFINELIVPKYSNISECISIKREYSSNLTEDVLCCKFYKNKFGGTEFLEDIRDEIKTIFKLLDRYDDNNSSLFIWITFDYSQLINSYTNNERASPSLER